MSVRNPKVGEPVVYSKSKRSPAPGPRAREVTPGAKGEQYNYVVDKYWAIAEIHEDGTVTIKTRRGKTHLIKLDDPCLRRANLWERLFYSSRFPRVSSTDRDLSSGESESRSDDT